MGIRQGPRLTVKVGTAQRLRPLAGGCGLKLPRYHQHGQPSQAGGNSMSSSPHLFHCRPLAGRVELISR